MIEKKLIRELTLIDTNLLVYSVDAREKKKHARAKEILQFNQENSSGLVVALQNLREFANIILKKIPTISENQLQEYLDVFQNSAVFVLYDNEIDVQEAIRLQKAQHVPFWDALLSTTMQRYGIHQILTENTKDFEKSGVSATNPL